ncbi:MAG: hypothetical protein P8X88_01590 [Gammaproteobacteria bacterium]
MILRHLLLLLVLSYFSIAVFAEEDQPKNQTEKEQKSISPRATVSKRDQIKTLEEFIPSEEVSADKPVAFPNDI